MVVHSGLIWEGLGERLKIDVLILIVLAATLVGVSAFGARIVVVRPIQRFRTAVERLRPENIRRLADSSGASTLPPTRTGIDSGDEIGDLARAFESMADELQKSHVELERRVEERTAAVADREAQLRTALDNMPGGMILLDSDGNNVLFNEQYRELHSYPDGFPRIGEAARATPNRRNLRVSTARRRPSELSRGVGGAGAAGTKRLTAASRGV